MSKKWRFSSIFLDFLIIFPLVLAALYLRSQNLPGKLWWDFDRSRDILASYNIWKYQDQPLVGHHASGLATFAPDGGWTVLKYPPIYFYYISQFWAVGKTLEGFLFVNTTLFSLSVITVYLIGRQLHNRQTAVIAAVLFAFSYRYIYDSWVIVGLQVGIPLYLLSICLYIYSLQKKIRPLNVIALSLLLIGSTFHYSVLVPFVLLFFLSEFVFNKKPLHLLVSTFVYGYYYVVFFLFLHIPVIAFFGLGSFQYGFLHSAGTPNTISQTVTEAVHLIAFQFHSLFGYYTKLVALLFGSAFSLSIFKSSISKQNKKIWILVTLIVALVVAGARQVSRYDGQLEMQTSLSVIVLLFLFAICFSTALEIIRNKNVIASRCFFFLVVGIAILSVGNTFDFIHWTMLDDSYTFYHKLAQQITKAPGYGSLNVITYDAASRNGSALLLDFPLEQLSNKQLITFGDYYGSGMTYSTALPQSALILCSSKNTNETSDEFCAHALDHFTFNNPNYKYVENGLCFESYHMYWLGLRPPGK